ncbi:SBDS family rRNA metabolism protein [Pneumocystis carinii B80]|uniref:Ribosome maturation protein SDO1 n=1 Tax=Pneumocystis carinii (strain B80) TaxID=1408658 RepID=A0A0W4ZD82_PNEC8|nr:SBDS family rRNA metabolism protein [Pneumocystis carinii B80]KTW26335.1 SBDS family rRNA metabolism protein [Pneumocystis carinii B80]
MVINQPSNLIKLTNVSVVRLKKEGKRFEIACYKNKVVEWRNGIEKDIDEVLQTNSVFTNVSKGQIACMEDLKKIFKTEDINEILYEILNKGEMQVGEKERMYQIENVYKDIVRTIVDKCVNPTTKKAYTTYMIENALKNIGFSVKLNKNVKSQALDAIKQLKKRNVIPIERARMRIRIVIPSEKNVVLKEELKQLMTVVMDEERSQEFHTVNIIIAYIDPGDYRRIINIVRHGSDDKGCVEVLDLKEIIDD